MKKYDIWIIALYVVVLLFVWITVHARLGKISQMQGELEDLNEKMEVSEIHTVMINNTDMTIHIDKTPGNGPVSLVKGVLNTTAAEGMRISRDTLYIEPSAGARYYLNMSLSDSVKVISSASPNVIVME